MNSMLKSEDKSSLIIHKKTIFFNAFFYITEKERSVRMLSSPIKWVGGKRLLRKEIIPLIPKCNCYVEAFGGAGWVLFGKDEKAHKVEVYNDINSEVVNLFRVLRNNYSEFEKKLEFLLISREVFDELKYQNLEELTDVDRAFRFWYLLKYSYGGRKNTLSDYSFGYSKERKPALLKNQKQLLLDAYELLQGVLIENLSYDELIKKYDGKETFFFFDPPYLCKGKFYGGNDFTKDDHITLKEKLSTTKGRWLLTVNDDEFFRELYKDFNIQQVSVNYSAGNATKGSGERFELIIINYDPQT